MYKHERFPLNNNVKRTFNEFESKIRKNCKKLQGADWLVKIELEYETFNGDDIN